MKYPGHSDYRGTVQRVSAPSSTLSRLHSKVAAEKELHYKFSKVSVMVSGLKRKKQTNKTKQWCSQAGNHRQDSSVGTAPHLSTSCGEVYLWQGRARWTVCVCTRGQLWPMFCDSSDCSFTRLLCPWDFSELQDNFLQLWYEHCWYSIQISSNALAHFNSPSPASVHFRL